MQQQLIRPSEVEVPTLFLDEVRCRRNIENMIARMPSLLHFRPHFKTHQSQAIGKWFRDYGVTRITASSLRMAKYFADDGWQDITVAFPVNLREIDLINELNDLVNLNVIVQDEAVIRMLNDQLQKPCNVLIKVDVGTGRTGVHIGNFEQLGLLEGCLVKSDKINSIGLLAHAGYTYGKTAKEVNEIYSTTHDAMLAARDAINPAWILSYGDTPSCTVQGKLTGFDEYRPGNFVFFDLMQERAGIIAIDEVAIAMAVPVVALHHDRGESLVYGGAVHFGKDAISINGQARYGRVCKFRDHSWVVLNAMNYLDRVSQEHGILKLEEKELQQLQPGDILGVLPVHSCMTAHHMGSYRLCSGEYVNHLAMNALNN